MSNGTSEFQRIARKWTSQRVCSLRSQPLWLGIVSCKGEKEKGRKVSNHDGDGHVGECHWEEEDESFPMM